MKKKQSAIYGLLILVITVITSLSYNRAECTTPPVDIDGNTYSFVTIGNRVWMRDNLNVSRYRNGDPIRQAKTNEEWLDAAAKREGAWCYYNNDPANANKYGRLYNWYALNDPRGIAPSGWHLPAKEDWAAVATTLTGKSYSEEKKSHTLTIWRYPALAVDNSIHFHAEPGGIRGTDELAFVFAGEKAFMWSSSEQTPTLGWYAEFDFQNAVITISSQDKRTGSAVRCIKD